MLGSLNVTLDVLILTPINKHISNLIPDSMPDAIPRISHQVNKKIK